MRQAKYRHTKAASCAIGQRVTGKPIYERGELRWGGPKVFVVSSVRLVECTSMAPYYRITAGDPERSGCYLEGAEEHFERI